MIAVDTNILVYAHRQDHEWHEAASLCLRSLAEGRATWAIPWPCVYLLVDQPPAAPRLPSSLAMTAIALAASPTALTRSPR